MIWRVYVYVFVLATPNSCIGLNQIWCTDLGCTGARRYRLGFSKTISLNGVGNLF